MQRKINVIPPSPAASVAQALVNRAKVGKDLRIRKAAEDVLVTNVQTIVGHAGIQRALSRLIREDDVAEMQLKCLKAFSYKMLKLPHGLDESDVDAIIENEDMHEVAREHVEGKGWFVTYRAQNYEYVDRALDKLYKIAGVYAPDKQKTQRDLEDMSDEELLQITQGVIVQQNQANAETVDRIIP